MSNQNEKAIQDAIENEVKEVTAPTPASPVHPIVVPVVPTDLQQPIIDEVISWYAESSGYSKYELAGFAGTGKTTIVNIILHELASRFNVKADDVALAAYTGTASLVLRDKTPGYDSSTLHKLFYKVEELPDGRREFYLTHKYVRGLKLIIIDEGSMVSKGMGKEILSIAKQEGVKVLVVGDPLQLPPVGKGEWGEDYFLLQANGILTEVLRQAAGNPIIKLSMAIRKACDDGLYYKFPNYDQNQEGKFICVHEDKVSIDKLAKVISGGGAFIVGQNRTRRSFNKKIRTKLGFGEPTLMEGEKVLIKDNSPSTETGEIDITNGMVGRVSDISKIDNGFGGGLLRFKFEPDLFPGYRYVEVYEDILFERITMFDLSMQLRKENRRRYQSKEKPVTYGLTAFLGYAITAHASQGSQWRVVYLLDQSSMCLREGGVIAANRWLYTAVTRASEVLVVMRRGDKEKPSTQQPQQDTIKPTVIEKGDKLMKDKNNITIALTGHRPDKLPDKATGYNYYNPMNLAIATKIREHLLSYLNEGKKIHAISGMALGCDTIFALVVLKLRNQGHPITLECAIPCANHSAKWIAASKKQWEDIVAVADKVTYVSDKPYNSSCMQKRNEYMTDQLTEEHDELIAVFGGSAGGTKNCIDYAVKQNKKIFYINPYELLQAPTATPVPAPIPTPVVTPMPTKTTKIPRVLECSTKGDKRFSAFCAKVTVFGKEDTIENHYQLCKRFDGVAPTTWKDAKGKAPTSIVLNGQELEVKHLSAFYTMMWVKYLDSNPDLVAFAKQFDDFNDIFRGKSVNCQADVIRTYIKEGREACLKTTHELNSLLAKKTTSAS